MFKIKSLLFFILLLVFCSTASARVCFLVGTNDPNSKYTNCIGGPLENYVPIVNCPDHSQCEIPAKGVKPCRESGSKLYKAEDCCSNSMLYEECSPAEGKVCQGTVCRGSDENGDDYVSCERGKCVCGAEYTQTCSEEGLVGVGIPCNGLYKECECDRTKFFKCDGIATELGAKCVDSTGEYYSGCVCPAPDGDDWVTDPDDCCSVSSVSCVNQPSGEEIFKCNPKPMYSCMCGYTYSKSGCQSGCIDDNYSYKGSRVNVTCTGGFSDSLLDAQDICGSGCTCAVGYWDYTETCNNSNADVCATLGYTETSCEDKYVACPFDASMKRCVQDVQSCEYSSAAECESDNFNSVCKSNELGCWSAVACKTGTQKSSDKCATEFGFVKPAKLVNADKQGCSVCEYAKDTCNEFNPNFYSETELKNKECKSNVLLDLNGSYKKCYYNCESKCTYADKNACESASENINSACQENENGCFVPSECKVGYFKEANEVNCKGATYTQLSGVDANGCGYCASEYDTCEQAGYINA
ncbi:MAG: hypothetical protein IJW75_01380, partial [Alphaproteobacteria bacterium]|nr:hypothetical protein [Alphaproteobacteria bacterium]